MPLTLMWLRAAAVIALVTPATAQQCYYADGSEAPDTDKPCSSAEGSACCPDNWQCLDNGLCHYPADNLYGRYSCTDKSWDSNGCPSNMCTYGMTASGGESITQCSNHDDEWCCNADATHVDCCQESPEPRPFFDLQDGVAYATIGSMTASTAPNLARFTGRALGGSSDDDDSTSASQTAAPESTNAASSSDASSEPAATEAAASSGTPVTSVSFSLSTGSTGDFSVPITNVITSAPTSTGNGTDGAANGGSNSNLGLIIGCAVGIPLGLAIIGLIFWLLRKRRQQKTTAYYETAQVDGDNGSFSGAAAGKLGNKQKFRNSAADTAEIDGNPIGAGQPVSTVNGRAELPSENGFQPGQGTSHGPDAVGIGGGNGRNPWDTIPPQYSPGNHQTTFAYPEATELADTSVTRSVNEKDEP